MKILALGGAGRYCRSALKILLKSGAVDELVIAGRSQASLDAAQAEVAPSGSQVKISTAQADILSGTGLCEVIQGADLVVNATGPYFKTLLPGLEAAIAQGADYIDYAEDGRVIREALALDDKAKAAGTRALVGMGEAPGLNSLLCRYAIEQFDQPQRLTCGWVEYVESLLGHASEELEAIRETGRVNGAMQAMLQAFANKPLRYRNGTLIAVEPFSEEITIPTPDGEMTAYPFGSGEPVTLPASGVGKDLEAITYIAGVTPPKVNELLRQVCLKIATGEIDATQAAVEVFTELAEKPDVWLAEEVDPEFRPTGVMAEGIKDGQAMRLIAGFNWNFATLEADEVLGTAASIAVGALALMSDKDRPAGIYSAEALFDPLPFFSLLTQKHALFAEDGPIIERWEEL